MVDRIADRGRNQRNDFFADTRNPAICLNEIEIDLVRISTHPHGVVLMEIGLLDRRIPEGNLLIEHRTKSPGHHSADLPFRRFRIDQGMSTIVNDVHAID